MLVRTYYVCTYVCVEIYTREFQTGCELSRFRLECVIGIVIFVTISVAQSEHAG